MMKLETRREVVPVSRLRGACTDLGITPARLIAVGLDARNAERRARDAVEIQYLTHCAGETPRRIQELDITHQPELAYLWNIQCRNGRAVLEGDADLARIIDTPEFAQTYVTLAALLSAGKADTNGEIFLVGCSPAPCAWDATGRGFTPLFGEEGRRRFPRIRRHDILWAEGERLVAAPISAIGNLDCIKTRTVFTASAPITMLSKVQGYMGTRIVVSAGREQTVLELGENAASAQNKPVVVRSASGKGLFLGNTDAGRGIKALTALERGSDRWRLALYPVSGPYAPAIVQA